MRLMVVAFVVGFVMASLPQAEAQPQRGPHQVTWCGTASPEGCSERTLAELLDKLDLPPAESLAEQGYSGLRILHYDAFENIWPAVTVISRPTGEYRREGLVEARSIHADGHVAALFRPIWEGSAAPAALRGPARRHRRGDHRRAGRSVVPDNLSN